MEIFNDQFDIAYSMENYLIQENFQRYQIMSYINECIALENGNIGAIKVINESLVDTIKNILAKLWNTITGLFKKFRERVAELFTTDKKFLEKYKDVILKNSFKSHNVTNMHRYDPDMLNVVCQSMPKFEISKMETEYTNQLNSQGDTTPKPISEERFIKEYLSKMSTKYPKVVEVKELIQACVRGTDGDPEDFDMVVLDKTKIYNYCAHFDATNNMLNKNNNIIAENQKQINIEITKMNAKIDDALKKAGEEPPKDNTTQQPAAGATAGQQDAGAGATASGDQNAGQGQQQGANEAVYSRVFDRVIIEGIDAKPNDAKGNGTNTQGSTVKKITQANTSDVKANQKQAEGISAQATNKEEAEKLQKKGQFIADSAKEFFEYCCTIFTTLMTEALAMYKTYMQVLRVHVRDYAGTTDTDTDGQKADEGSSSNPVIAAGEGDSQIRLYAYKVDSADIAELVGSGNKSILDPAKKDFTKDAAGAQIPAVKGLEEMLINNANNSYSGKKAILLQDHVISNGKVVLYNSTGNENDWKFGIILSRKK